MADESKPQSWWQTLPGILTSVTGTITAIIGLVAVLKQAGFFPAPQPSPLASPAAMQSVLAVQAVPTGPNFTPSEAPRTPSGGPLSSNDPNYRITSFVHKYLAVQDSGDVPALLELYGQQVDYFGHPGVRREFILQDKESYYRQWRVLQNDVVGKITVTDGPNAGEKIATFTVHYHAVNERLGKDSEGTATNILTIRDNDGELRIVGEIQTFYHRGPA
jgi:hypothetical protein